jgi:hypothetical protein
MLEAVLDPRGFVVLCLAVALVLCCLYVVQNPELMSRIESALTGVTVYPPYDDHADDKHGLAVTTMIRTCIDNGGTLESWYNPTTLRSALVCKPNEKFAVQIARFIETVKREVTSFPKEKLITIEAVRRYLNNRGYYDITTPEFQTWLAEHPEHLPFLPKP